MKSLKNEKLIKRNRQIGQWTSLAALIVLGGGMYISFRRTDLLAYAFAALLIGLTLTQISIYVGNRFGRTPRPDEKLDAGLKGLQNEYILYHYLTPVSHLLVGPAGVWALRPYHQHGKITYRKNRWRLSGGGLLQAYMRIFAQEGLGRPDIELISEINALNKYLAQHLAEDQIPPIQAMLVFTSNEVEIDAAGAPIPAVKLKDLKEFFRKKAKEKPISQTQMEAVKAVLPK